MIRQWCIPIGSNRSLACGLITLGFVGKVMAGPCSPTWETTIGTPGSDSLASSLIAYDDGSGPSLFVGGGFSSIGNEPIETVARWDGSQWHPVVGKTGSRIYNNVNEFEVYDDGSGAALYASTAVQDPAGILRSGVAKWDGAEWTVVGILPARSLADPLAVFDDGTGPALYAGGAFATINGVPVNHLAKWDGHTWSDVGGGVSHEAIVPVRALEVFDDGRGPALYVGGWYDTAGGITCNSIAKWDGEQWSPLGTGLGGYPYFCEALGVFDDGTGPALFVGGAFFSAGGSPARSIAKWDGKQWSALGTGVNSIATSLNVFDDGTGSGPALFVGGFFTQADGLTVDRIAKWDGHQWSSLNSTLNYEVYDLEVFDDGLGPSLFMCGQFMIDGGSPGNRVTQYRACINGDFDLDHDVDLTDFRDFALCFNGAARPPADNCEPAVDADFDGDGDVDMTDYLTFAQNFTGAR